MGRKTIAILVSGYHPESDSKVISEIIRNCKENDINVLLFISLMSKSGFPYGIDMDSNLVRGETEIFNLVNYKKIDALVLFGNTIFDTSIIPGIIKLCEKNDIPYVNVNNPSRILAHNVMIENTNAMELVMEHLIKVHRVNRINFIGGFPDNQETVDRLNAYKRILQKYKIPLEEKRIAYGHFWKHSVECVKRFFQNDVPEAIVCANDTMAIFVSDYLKNQGYRIPEDIIVTGFDGTKDASLYEPSITTVRPRYYYAGLEVFLLIQGLIQGKNDFPQTITVESELITQDSCGCKNHHKISHNFIEEKYDQQSAYEGFNKQIVRSDVLSFDEQTSDELFEHLVAPLDVFNFKNFIFCIDNNLETEEEYFFGNKSKKSVMPAKVRSVLPYNVRFSEGKVFNSKDLLWYDFLNQSESVIRCFTPLYFKDSILGYMVYEPSDFEQIEKDLFQLWTYHAAEKIGTFYMNRELELLNSKDHLTGLYNRRGMEKYFNKVRNLITTVDQYLTVVCIDIDFLKTINDKYGHEAGDNAIIQTSNAIKYAFSKDSIGVRTGGDEFCVLHHSEKNVDIEKFIHKFTDYLKNYNENSNLPYEIMGSCGFYKIYSDEFVSFEEMSRKADINLYLVKEQHHTYR